jgi:hypothetical protein
MAPVGPVELGALTSRQAHAQETPAAIPNRLVGEILDQFLPCPKATTFCATTFDALLWGIDTVLLPVLRDLASRFSFSCARGRFVLMRQTLERDGAEIKGFRTGYAFATIS